MYKNNLNYYDQRFFPAIPFLFGALTGGVAVGAINGLSQNKYPQGYYYPVYYNYPYYYK